MKLRLTSLLVLVAASLLLVSAGVAEGIESKCSANTIIGGKLWSRLEDELRHKKELDLTHRLDSKGGRLGRKISYRDSELRYVKLLENFCEKLPYALPLNLSGKTLKEDDEVDWVVVTDDLKNLAEQQYNHKHAKEMMKTNLGNHCFWILDEYEESLTEILKAEDWVGDKSKGAFLDAFHAMVSPQCRKQGSPSAEQKEL